MKKRKLNSNEIKALELDLLIKFDKFCKEKGIVYTMCGGTLLGAVRHKGFIPWDDDIDVLVSRDDFARLLEMEKAGEIKIGEDAEICSWKSGRIPEPIIKICNPKTEVIENFIDPKYKVMVWIDVFPVDGMPDSEEELVKTCAKVKRMRYLVMTAYSRLWTGTSTAAKLVKLFLIPALKLVNIPAMSDRIHEISSKYDEKTANTKGGIVWGYGAMERMPKNFLETTKLTFEGHEFSASVCYDYYLRSLYGDYMKLPPEDKRVSHNIEAYIYETDND